MHIFVDLYIRSICIQKDTCFTSQYIFFFYLQKVLSCWINFKLANDMSSDKLKLEDSPHVCNISLKIYSDFALISKGLILSHPLINSRKMNSLSYCVVPCARSSYKQTFDLNLIFAWKERKKLMWDFLLYTCDHLLTSAKSAVSKIK